MDVQWLKMVVIRPGASYSAGERLYWPEYHFSLRVPPACTCDAGQIYAFLRSSETGFEALLNVHKPSQLLVTGWLDEPFTADRERLEPIAPMETKLGVKSRQFASASTAGYKMTVDDPFRYRASARVTGPADRAGDLSLLLRQIVGSIRFVHQDAFNEEQQRQAILPWLNIDASNNDELLLYIDRHFYLLRNDLMALQAAVAKPCGCCQCRGECERCLTPPGTNRIDRQADKGWTRVDDFVVPPRSSGGAVALPPADREGLPRRLRGGRLRHRRARREEVASGFFPPPPVRAGGSQKDLRPG